MLHITLETHSVRSTPEIRLHPSRGWQNRSPSSSLCAPLCADTVRSVTRLAQARAAACEHTAHTQGRVGTGMLPAWAHMDQDTHGCVRMPKCTHTHARARAHPPTRSRSLCGMDSPSPLAIRNRGWVLCRVLLECDEEAVQGGSLPAPDERRPVAWQGLLTRTAQR